MKRLVAFLAVVFCLGMFSDVLAADCSNTNLDVPCTMPGTSITLDSVIGSTEGYAFYKAFSYDEVTTNCGGYINYAFYIKSGHDYHDNSYVVLPSGYVYGPMWNWSVNKHSPDSTNFFWYGLGAPAPPNPTDCNNTNVFVPCTIPGTSITLDSAIGSTQGYAFYKASAYDETTTDYGSYINYGFSIKSGYDYYDNSYVVLPNGYVYGPMSSWSVDKYSPDSTSFFWYGVGAPLHFPLDGSLESRTISLDFGDTWTFGECPTGIYKKHAGIDLSATADEEVYAAHAGTVRAIYTGQHSQWADAVVVEADNGQFTTVYWHVIKFGDLATNDHVTKGQQIATVADLGGNTHFHFGVRSSSYNSSSSLAGALPEEDCGGYLAFPENFVDPAQLAYE